MKYIVPYVQMFQAGLVPGRAGRSGVFLLLGPTGTGKTKTVEALADVLHGSEKNVLKVDCGEFQMEHEVAKLIGAPPGYLGHRETQPMLTQQKLNAVTSEKSNLVDRAVRRDREGRAVHDAPAARRAGQRHAAAGRQHHRQFREQPDLSDQQPGRPGDDEGDASRLRLPGRRGAAPTSWTCSASSRASARLRCARSSRRSSSTASTR